MGNCVSPDNSENKDKERSEPVLVHSGTVVVADNSDLIAADPSTINIVPHKNKIIDVRVVSVYDGDTCTVLYKIANGIVKINIRILDVDTPEVKVRVKEKTELMLLEMKAGAHVRDKVEPLINGKILKAKFVKWDAYGGRIDGELYLPSGQTLAEYLIYKKYGKPYKGRKKESWTEEELNYILQH